MKRWGYRCDKCLGVQRLMAMQVIRLQGFIGASSIFPPFVPATNGPTAFSPQVKTIVNRLINYRISIRRPATVQCHRRLSTDAAPSSNHGQGQKSADHYAVIVISPALHYLLLLRIEPHQTRYRVHYFRSTTQIVHVSSWGLPYAHTI